MDPYCAALRKSGCGVDVFSSDSLRSPEGLKAKLELPFELISDADEAVCNLFGVIKMKNMYGKQVRGIERSTFLVAADGPSARERRRLKVPGDCDGLRASVGTLK